MSEDAVGLDAPQRLAEWLNRLGFEVKHRGPWTAAVGAALL